MAPLVMRAGVEPAAFFGTFNSLMSFSARDEAFDTDARKARNDASPGVALRVYVRPTLRLRVGRVLATSAAEVERWSSRADGPFFYEPGRDTLFAAAGDVAVLWTNALLYEVPRAADRRLLVGLTHSRLRVNQSDLNLVQRLGAVLTMSSDGRVGRLHRPTATLMLARYVDDPSKKDGWNAAISLGVTLSRR